MNRREYLKRSGFALAGSGALRRRRGVSEQNDGDYHNASDDYGEQDDGQNHEEYRNPVFDRVFPDPTAVRAPDGTYFAYATYHEWDDGGDDGEGGDKNGDGPVWGDRDRPLVPILRSQNLVNWEFVGPAFEAKPDWHESVGVWAPDAARHRGEYLLYYSLSSWGDPNPGIGVAAADSPTGPFEDRGKLLQSEGIGVPNSIDPCFFAADDGTPYLFWGSHRGIYGIRLAPDGRSLAGEKFQVAGDGAEAPYLLARDGRYYLFGSRGRCCEGAASDYRVVVGRADDLRGPYRNRNGEDLLDATGTTILEGDDEFAGPGHNAVVADDAGDDWLIYHAYERANPWVGETPRRVLMLDRLRWRDGWPTVPGDSPGRTAPKPSVTESSRGPYRETQGHFYGNRYRGTGQ